MMIEKHISALLYRYQCVTVPGFGAFITEAVSARYNETTHAFVPPKKTILFNSLLQQNDGLLANHIALEENISFNQAVALIYEQVNSWKNALNEKQIIYLKNIGELSLNSEQKLQFEPVGSTNYLTSSFGLSAVVANALTKEEQTNTKVVALKPTASKPRLQWMRYAAAVAAVIGLYSSVSTYQEYEVYQGKKLAVEKEVQSQIEQKLQQATFVIETPQIIKEKVAEVTSKIEQKPFHIVAGAFKTEAKAQILTNELKAKGYANAKYLTTSKHNMRPVVYNSYATQEEAQQELRLIHEKVNKDAWIFIEN
ncbi:SPOR domain-containing protein [Flavobacterium sp. CBA20B-1]|uniref:HU domain-containing protein n=1 Tax=unclassified Flavobacterium TaxID=196869 RepID=UPI002224BCCD|nr:MULTISPECIES: SPOR domain-containing protein [unclassified Flavobacterium]WCM41125.1 SPOR domain-containing protein [Flavobacterium sp. CBA20B-1]